MSVDESIAHAGQKKSNSVTSSSSSSNATTTTATEQSLGGRGGRGGQPQLQRQDGSGIADEQQQGNSKGNISNRGRGVLPDLSFSMSSWSQVCLLGNRILYVFISICVHF